MMNTHKGQCLICATDEPSNEVEFSTNLGRVTWGLCDPCMASRVSMTWQKAKEFKVNGVTLAKPTDLKRFVELLPTKQKCSACGSKCNEAHWHFANGNVPGRTRVVGGRAFYCNAECCLTCDDDPIIDWDEDDDEWIDWDEDDDEELFWEDEDEVAVAKAKGYVEDDDWDEDDWDF